MKGYKCDNCGKWNDGSPEAPSFVLPATVDLPLVKHLRVSFDVLVSPEIGKVLKYMDICYPCRESIRCKLVEKLGRQ